MFLLPTVLSTLTAVSAMSTEAASAPTEIFMTENIKSVYAGNGGDADDSLDKQEQQEQQEQGQQEQPLQLRLLPLFLTREQEQQRQEWIQQEQLLLQGWQDLLQGQQGQQLQELQDLLQEQQDLLQGWQEQLRILQGQQEQLQDLLQGWQEQQEQGQQEQGQQGWQEQLRQGWQEQLRQDLQELQDQDQPLQVLILKRIKLILKPCQLLEQELYQLQQQEHQEPLHQLIMQRIKRLQDLQLKKLKEFQQWCQKHKLLEPLQLEHKRLQLLLKKLKQHKLQIQELLQAIKKAKQENGTFVDDESKFNKAKNWVEKIKKAKENAAAETAQKGWLSKIFGKLTGNYTNSQYGIAKRKLKCFELCQKDCTEDEAVLSIDAAIEKMEKYGIGEQVNKFLEEIKENAKKFCEEEKEKLLEALSCNCNESIDVKYQQKCAEYWHDYAQDNGYKIDDVPDFLNSANADEETTTITSNFGPLIGTTKHATNEFNILRDAKKFFITNMVKMNFLRKM